ncbi:MAG: tRNA lysidine(34) synthetase TilS [Bacilli bacterium]|nr:tRNA lysidine(34) synthetase TilS [Bacilli bacterium]MBQ9731301.1 tRNA lysidine(34) synthetase TilS [Bacilli bacterium]
MNKSISNLDKQKTFLIAVSGGADSMALLDMLRVSSYKIVVCHVNYKSRPTSDRDEQIVKDYCNKYGIELYIDYPFKKEKENFEKWAREERYTFFKKIYDEKKIDYLLVAHHRDDVIETYLMKKARKSVGKSKAISRENYSFGMNILRPLFDFSKVELREYCEKNKVEFGDDETNFEPIYSRNKLRLEKLSLLSEEEKEEFFNKIVKEDEEWTNYRENILSPYKNLKSLNFSKLVGETLDSQILILYDYIAFVLKDESLNERLSKKRILDILEKLKNKSNVLVELTKDVFLVREYEKLWIKSEVFEKYIFKLDCFEKLKTPYFEIGDFGKNMEGVCVLESDYPLTIRPYENNDYIKIKDGHKSVRRLYIDKKIPMSIREKMPILLNKDGEILLIPSLYKEVERKSLQSNFFMIKYHKY